MGKILKLLLEAHAAAGTLEATSYPEGGDLPLLQDLMQIFADRQSGQAGASRSPP